MTGNRYNNKYEEEKQVAIISESKPFLGIRWIFTLLGMLTFFIMFFSRNSFSVAIVVMVNETDVEDEIVTDACPLALQNRSDDKEEEEVHGEFNWSASEQGLILASFFWGIIIAKIFGSRLVEVIGQRRYVGTGVAVAGVLLLLSPLAAEIHPLALATTNFLIGLVFGPNQAALFSLLSVWAPRYELGTMTAIMQAGGPLGVSFGIGICGWLAENVGWRSPFWVSGGLCFVFLPFWIISVRNTPQEHPWLSPYEEKILQCNKDIKTQKTVPWRLILKSPYVYICIISLFARSWSEVLFSSGGPTYFNRKIGLSLTNSSFVCSARFFSSLVMLPIYGRISDKLVKGNYVKKKNVRKLFHLMGSGGLALLFVAIALVGCKTKTAITLWVISGAVSSGSSLSFPVSIIDFAPNYAGTIVGLMGVGNLGSALVPVVVSSLVQKENGWDKSFYVSAALNVVSCFLYIFFMTDQAQPWNFPSELQKKKTSDSSEDKIMPKRY